MITLRDLQIYFTPNKKVRAEIVNDKITKLNKILFSSDTTNKEIALIIRTMRDDAVHELKRRKSSIESELVETAFAINSL